jgi:hypothetical protein
MSDRVHPVLMRSIIIFVIMIVVSVVMIIVSNVYMSNIYDDKQSATRAMRIWQKKINSSVENNQIIDEFESNFLKLVNQGVVGDENRLSWFETIQNAARKRNMPLVKYSISTREQMAKANLKREYNGIYVYKSLMTLDIDMAHEGDLFAILNDLDKADGLYTVNHCEISKTQPDIEISDHNLDAFCELGWYTFKGEKAAEGKNNAS